MLCPQLGLIEMQKKVRRGSDQFMLRLPDGLRDRIKAYADRQGRSMNAEIVRTLEREFPEPWAAGARIGELLTMVRILKEGATEERINHLVHELEETLDGIKSGRVKGLGPEARQAISSEYSDWQLREDEKRLDEFAGELDQEEEQSLSSNRPH